MAQIPVLNAVRIIPRDSDFLDRKSGSRGEIFFDRTANTLRLYNGIDKGGINLAKSDLSNVSNDFFLAKAISAGVGSGGGPGGGASISVSAAAPADPNSGNLWFNSETGILYVYVEDTDSQQWVQPSVPLANLSDVAFTGSYNDLTDIPEGTNVDLTGYATESFVTTAISNIDISAVVLTGLATEDYVDTAISNLVDTAPATLNTLNELAAALNDDANFATTVTTALGTKAPINNPIFTGTVTLANGAPTIITNADFTFLRMSDNSPAGYHIALGDTGGTFGLTVGQTVTLNFNFGDPITVTLLLVTYDVDPVDFFGNFGELRFAWGYTAIPPLGSELVSIEIPGEQASLEGATLTGTTTLQQSTEILNTKSFASGTVTHDFSTGAIWYHSSISANFTANFTNIPTTDNRTTVVTLILRQGGPENTYIPNAVQINSSSVTINWLGGEQPSGTPTGHDIVSFTLIRVSVPFGAWVVLGSLTSYEAV
jgi:hypothetical protein